MECSFVEIKITSTYHAGETQHGYKLSNGVVLFFGEQDQNGYYLGAVGMDGIYLRTGKRYQPIADSTGKLIAFRERFGEL
jgi:hypothetical protein